MIFSIPKNYLSDLVETVRKQLNVFTTSAAVVMKSSGLRIEVIRGIARKVGVEIKDIDSRCIDEELLSLLADAHVRQIKSYFYKTKRHIFDLSDAELSTFIDFCKIFKKQQSNNSETSWDNIDENAIREQFINKVYSLTPRLSSIISDCINLEFLTQSPRPKLFTKDTLLLEQQRNLVISRLLNNRWLYMRHYKPKTICCDSRTAVRCVTLSSRYYIFSDDDYHIAC